MHRSLLLAALIPLLAATGCQSDGQANGHSTTAPGRNHHIVYAPGNLNWRPAPPSLLPGAEMAVLEGDPNKGGFFAMRLRFPPGYRVMPHWHPKHERVTVIAGTLYLGSGDTFDESATRELQAGSYSSMTPGMRHFACTKGPVVLQLATEGPWGIRYVNPADDPRNGRAATAPVTPTLERPVP